MVLSTMHTVHFFLCYAVIDIRHVYPILHGYFNGTDAYDGNSGASEHWYMAQINPQSDYNTKQGVTSCNTSWNKRQNLDHKKPHPFQQVPKDCQV